MQKIHEFQFLYLFKTTGKWKQVQDLLNLQKENEMIQHNARLEVIATEQKAANIRVQFEEVNLQIAMEELKKIRYENSMFLFNYLFKSFLVLPYQRFFKSCPMIQGDLGGVLSLGC